MSEEIINQAFETAETSTPSPEPIEQATVTEDKAPAEAIEPSEEVAFPKKAVNALSRRDKQIGKLQAQLAAERAELAKYREQQTKVADNSPKEESFENYGEYLKALARHEAKQELSQTSKQQQDQQAAAQQEVWHADRTEYALDKAREAINSIPDYKQLFMENSDVLQSLPPHIERAFLEADEPALAFYALAKEGKLETILDMSPARAAIEIGRAEVRGMALSKARPVTKAPAPIDSLKGVGGAQKTLDTMNSKELMAWVSKKG